MTIDIRATVTCSLGTLISGSLNDDYVQGTGLIKCRGSVELSGLVTPAIGTAVEFSYTRGGVATYIPRKLRVLSSFADPYRRTTRVELGCKLTYLQDLNERIKWDALDDPENSDITEADTEIVTVPIRASSAMDWCLAKLGITADRNPLTNKFSIAEFDYSAGYVQVLSNLLVSECYVGYLNRNEVLQVLSLDQEGGSGPVVTRERIIDLGPIGAGQLPGEAVTVSYSTLRLKYPEGVSVGQPSMTALSPFERTTSRNVSDIVIAYSTEDGDQRSAVFPVLQTTETVTRYRKITNSDGEKIKVVSQRITEESTSAVAVLGGLVSAYLAAGYGFRNAMVSTRTVELFYHDSNGDERKRIVERRGSEAHAIGQVGLPMAFEDGVVGVSYGGSYLLEKQIVETTRFGRTVQVETRTYGPWIKSISGQQSIAESRDSFTTASQVSAFISKAISGVCLLNVSVECSDTDYRGQRMAAGSAMNAAPLDEPAEAVRFGPPREDPSDGTGDPNNGYRTESKAGLALAVGSASAQRRIELSLPYAPDDVFIKNPAQGIPSATPTFTTVKSDAEAKARRFGRVQNRLLLGNRSGMSLQTAIGTLPNHPFAPFIVEANGLSGLYRTNGSSWTFDANGIIHSTDALFMGAAGGTGDFWFPVAPGVTTLPTAPAVVDTTPSSMAGSVPTVGASAQTTLSAAFPGATTGQGALDQATGDVWTYGGSAWTNVGPNPGPTTTVAGVVGPWNETIELIGRCRSRVYVASLAYALTLPVVTITAKARSRAVVQPVVFVDLPTASLTLAGLAPEVAAKGVNVALPVAELAISALAPAVSAEGTLATVVSLPVAGLAISALAPDVAQAGANVELPTTGLQLSALAPEVAAKGVNVDLPVTSLVLTGLAPTVENPGVVALPVEELQLIGLAPAVQAVAGSGPYTSGWAAQNATWLDSVLDEWWAN